MPLPPSSSHLTGFWKEVAREPSECLEFIWGKVKKGPYSKQQKSLLMTLSRKTLTKMQLPNTTGEILSIILDVILIFVAILMHPWELMHGMAGGTNINLLVKLFKGGMNVNKNNLNYCTCCCSTISRNCNKFYFFERILLRNS